MGDVLGTAVARGHVVVVALGLGAVTRLVLRSYRRTERVTTVTEPSPVGAAAADP